MDKVREPPSPDDDAAWDIEAAKLLLIAPNVFNDYIRHPNQNFGWIAWDKLGFGTHPTEDMRESFVLPDPRRTTASVALINACVRLSKEIKHA